MLDAIKAFAIRDDDDWKRCLVCGVMWLPGSIAINTRQLRLLIDKCKSSINGSLHRMGYSSATSRGDTSRQLIEYVPKLRGNFNELRQWTVRQINAHTPQPPVPIAIGPQRRIPISPEPMHDLEDWEPAFPVAENLRQPENSFFDDELTLPLVDWVGTKDDGMNDSPGLQIGSLLGLELL
jgi:hypothetical protein